MNRLWVYGLGGFLLLLLAGCGDVGGSGQCGGVSNSLTCLKVTNILPTYEVGGGETSNVDAFIDICDIDATTGALTLEDMTDHAATVTFQNDPIPGADSTDARDVTITRYTIVYTLNNCPTGAICPTLSSVTVTPGETILILANSSVSRDLKFVDLAKKMEYAEAIGDDLFPATSGPAHTAASLRFPSYTATYTFSGTDIFNEPISVQGHTEFTIGDFANCT